MDDLIGIKEILLTAVGKSRLSAALKNFRDDRFQFFCLYSACKTVYLAEYFMKWFCFICKASGRDAVVVIWRTAWNEAEGVKALRPAG